MASLFKLDEYFEHGQVPTVKVDMHAVPHICNRNVII